VNAPFTGWSRKSGNGDVYQRNDADNDAVAKNHNDTDQAGIGRAFSKDRPACCDSWRDLPSRGVEPPSSVGHQVRNTLQPGLAGGLLLLFASLGFAAARSGYRGGGRSVRG
jgi:hypothetical protein